MKSNIFVSSKALSFVLILVLLTSYSCNKDPKTHLEFINGYWEIEQVTFSNGETKTYQYNDMIDYIKIEDNKGFRKKMKPNIDETFTTSKDQEDIEVRIENDSLNLYYNTALSSWKETVLSADENQLIITLDNEVVYQYKRYQPIIINQNTDE